MQETARKNINPVIFYSILSNRSAGRGWKKTLSKMVKPIIETRTCVTKNAVKNDRVNIFSRGFLHLEGKSMLYNSKKKIGEKKYAILWGFNDSSEAPSCNVPCHLGTPKHHLITMKLSEIYFFVKWHTFLMNDKESEIFNFPPYTADQV